MSVPSDVKGTCTLNYTFWFCDCKLLHSLCLCGWSLSEISLSVLRVKLLHSTVIKYIPTIRIKSSQDYISERCLVHPLGITGCLPRKIYKVLGTGASDKVGHKQVLQDFAEPASAPMDVLAFPHCPCTCPYIMHWGKWPNSLYFISKQPNSLPLFPRVICLN